MPATLASHRLPLPWLQWFLSALPVEQDKESWRNNPKRACAIWLFRSVLLKKSYNVNTFELGVGCGGVGSPGQLLGALWVSFLLFQCRVLGLFLTMPVSTNWQQL